MDTKPYSSRHRYSAVIGILSIVSLSEACNIKNFGWGHTEVILPKPTLLPKLAAAFHEGKASVALKGHYGKSLIHGVHNLHAVHNLHGGGYYGKGKGYGKYGNIGSNGLGWGGSGYEYGYGVGSPKYGDFKEVHQKGYGGHIKGHYAVKDWNSYKHFNYDLGHPLDNEYHAGEVAYASDHVGDYAPGFYGKKK